MMKRALTILCLVLSPAAISTAEEMTLAEAVAAQEALAETDPSNARLFNDLGNLLLLVDRNEDAEAAYRQAAALDPELVSARFNLALLLQQTGRAGKATLEFRQVLKLDPDHAWSHYQLGVLNDRVGKRNVAIRRYAEALRLDPRLTDPAFNPHILDNTLAPSATLKAYADLTSADLVPRTYESPRRIAGMLVTLPPREGEQEAAPMPQAEDEGAASPKRTPRRKKQPPRRQKKDMPPAAEAEDVEETSASETAKPVPQEPVPQEPEPEQPASPPQPRAQDTT